MNSVDIAEKIHTSDSPVLICDENLFVIDSNSAAKRALSDKAMTDSFEKHLGSRELATVKSLMFCADNNIERRTYHAVAEVLKIKYFRIALICIKKYFGKNFYEIHLYKTRRELLQSIESRSYLAPPAVYVPKYNLTDFPGTVDKNASELRRVFENDMLSNLWSEAQSPSDREFTFDVISLTKRLTLDIAKRLGFLNSEFMFSAAGVEKYVSSGANLGNFINLYTLLMYLTGSLSSEGRVKIFADGGGDGAGIVFSFKAEKSDITFVGEFAFTLLADMYPRYSSIVHIINYMCELFGISCYADVDRPGSLTVELLLSDKAGTEEFVVMHGDMAEYFNNIDKAIKLLK